MGLGFNALPGALGSSRLSASMFLCGVPGTALSAVMLNLVLPGRPKGGADEEDAAAEEPMQSAD